MLIKPTAEEAEHYIDFAYELALEPARSGYPTYADGIKTKEDFTEACRYAFSRNDREVLLFLEHGVVSGWIQFILEKEDAYLETNIFNISGSISTALKEFIEYCDSNFPDYSICMGFPGDNKDAIEYLSRNGWCCEERSYNDVLYFDDYELRPESPNTRRISRDNYSDFRLLHEPIEGDMYWNTNRLCDDLDNWGIFVHYEEKIPSAAIYYRDSEILMHIYGLDYRDNVYQASVFHTLMTKALNECKREGKKWMVFFGEQQDQQEALALGYRCVGEYVLYTRRR